MMLRRHAMSITNENEPTRPEAEVAEAIPHSGIHFGEQPVDIFDNTGLEEANQQGLIGPVPETIPPSIEQPLLVSPLGKSKKFIGFGAGAAALALAGGAFMLTQKDDKPTRVAAQVATSAPTSTPTTVPTSSSTPEAINTDNQPVFITGTTPEQIVGQYVHNMNCSLNAPTPDMQTACLEHNLGNLEHSGTLGPIQLETIRQTNTYRESHPDFKLLVDMKVQDSKMTESQLEVVVIESDHAGSYYRYMRFVHTSATVENLTVDGAVQDIWLIREVRNIQPGEITFH